MYNMLNRGACGMMSNLTDLCYTIIRYYLNDYINNYSYSLIAYMLDCPIICFMRWPEVQDYKKKKIGGLGCV